MSNGHGGKRVGAGRKRTKPLADKILDGTVKKHKHKILDFDDVPDLGEALGIDDLPVAPEFLNTLTSNGIADDVPNMKKVFDETVKWLNRTNCLHLINPHLITKYAINTTRYLECEYIVSRTLLTKKNGEVVPNPLADQGLRYSKAADLAWSAIWEIVMQNCQEDFGGRDPQIELMESLLNANMTAFEDDFEVEQESENHAI